MARKGTLRLTVRKAKARAREKGKERARAKMAPKAKERAKVSLKALSHRRPRLKEKVSSQVALHRALPDRGPLNSLLASLGGTGLSHKLLQEFLSILRVIGLRNGNSLGTLVGMSLIGVETLGAMSGLMVGLKVGLNNHLKASGSGVALKSSLTKDLVQRLLPLLR